MKNEIDRYINEINKSIEMNKNTFEDEVVWQFKGDGEGDFEEIASDVRDIDILYHYIQHCKRQIELATEYSKTREDWNGAVN